MDERHQAIVRALTPAQKMRALQGLQHTARIMLKAGLRMRHPELSEAELDRRVRDATLYAKH